MIVAQLAPPSEMSAARRIAGLTKYLARRGHHVTVVTSAISGDGAIEGAARVIRTPDLLTSRLNWRRAQFDALRGADPDPAASYDAHPSRLARWIVPDLGRITWTPFARSAAGHEVRAGEVDCVITSGPPHSTHLLGAALRRRGSAWIADLRDGWAGDPRRIERPRLVAALDDRYERSALRAADHVVAATQPIASDLRRRLGIDATTLTNGYDPEETHGPADGTLLDPARVSVVHTGSLGYGGVSLAPLLDAVQRMAARTPELLERLEILLAGPLTQAERDAIEAAPTGAVRHLGRLPREQALALQRAADALLVITSGHALVATGKLYEYFAAGRPVLVLGEATAAAKIVRESRAGWSAPHDDPDAIAARLADVVRGPREPAGSEALRVYSYEEIAGELSRLVSRVVGLR
jgi:glycosyltransferase involved in cell wall biosynthesis